ncbi:hypothetical protein AVEN_173234-1 [Araneus ventricosus]|uniref:Uncharacterized protein n=1 Tax=Araneus ventricosus TaxID=182803 RepID=A0A4Y2H151_ARAVE|nr:hypothetical protein AVEN_173234-1 [Araneus ventricosus]
MYQSKLCKPLLLAKIAFRIFKAIDVLRRRMAACYFLNEGERNLDDPDFWKYYCRGDLVVRTQFWGWRVPDTKHYSTKDLPCIWSRHTLNVMSWVKRPPVGAVRKFGKGVVAS